MIQVNGLSLAYHGANEGHVLENLTFSAHQGQKIALIGANGAGKSTLLLALAGVLPVHGGEIWIDGIKVEQNNLAAVRRRAGLVFQNPDDQLFMPTIGEDVLFGPRNYARLDSKSPAAAAASIAEAERKADGLLAALGIAGLKTRVSHKLSGGEKRLAALASVLVMEPALLMLDEPTAFLDPKGRRGLIAVLNGLPHTMLIATHDMDFARAVCSHALILAGKTIRAAGPAAALLADAALLEACGL
ncbi:MAG: energy-coupling factor ABC transporter ATP-binding protein [Spirochaetaceae bacterium]|jgi:cobalt/nickel transport system ATP-binding protein|nr:energy-coupling factor ABC transporter ATP-binding protein [Spirochaetaceae bacterium]